MKEKVKSQINVLKVNEKKALLVKIMCETYIYLYVDLSK